MELTMQQEQALAVARMLAKAGVPMFLAQEDPHSPLGHKLPFGWETNEPNPEIVDAWRPGYALCAVTGHTFDLVDIDPRSGGHESAIEMPHSYLTAETPSGGRHHFIRTLGVSSLDGKVAPGIDVKSGTAEGVGRGFAFIAPTIRRSKVTGELGEYRWVFGPKGPLLPSPDQLAADGSGGMLRARVMELRRASASTVQRRIPQSQAEREWNSALQRLRDDVAHWMRNGWGGEAHSGILAATTHLARLNPERALAGMEWAFVAAGAVMDERDAQKLQSAVDRAIPDVIVPDSELSPAEAFFMGGDQPPALQPGGSLPGAPSSSGMAGSTSGTLPAAITGEGPDPFRRVTPERFDDRTPPRPTEYGLFGGALPLFYSDGVHWVYGESESGKSWVAFATLVEVLRAGGTALVVDYEDTEDRVFERLAQLGLTGADVERLVYVEAQNITFGQLVNHVHATSYDLVVVDGVTSALSSAGLSGRDEQELTRWADALPRRARMAICIDHVTKDVENRNGMAIGTQAKKSVVTGSAFEVRAKEKFGRGSNGVIELRLHKDKPGFLRGKNIKALSLIFTSDAQTGAVTLLVKGAGSQATDAAEFFDATRAAETWAVVMALEAYSAALPHHSSQHLKKLLRGDMGVRGRNEDLEDAIRAFKVRAGMAGVRSPEGLMKYAETTREGRNDERTAGALPRHDGSGLAVGDHWG